jgi:hypothetical protein
MQANPYAYAVAALSYIAVVALFMRFIETLRHDTPDTLVDGMGFLSLFVLSVATMAFLFFYQPVVLLLEHKKREAVTFFLKTLFTFGASTTMVLTVVILQ